MKSSEEQNICSEENNTGNPRSQSPASVLGTRSQAPASVLGARSQAPAWERNREQEESSSPRSQAPAWERNSEQEESSSPRSQAPAWERNSEQEESSSPRSNASALECKGLIMNIQDLSFQDGPGIRTTIFFKGCPLRCKWCSNPEGQNFFPEIMHSEILCKKSFSCNKICPFGSVTIKNENFPEFDREKCKICDTKNCVEACNNSALKIVGEYFTADEIIKKVIPNIRFYKNSGGGLTLSGGEPLNQPKFVRELIGKSSNNDLSVGVETCGFFNWNEVEDFIDKFEFIYFDLKCVDKKSYLEFTGVDEKIILENLTKIAKINSSKIIITIPIIPDINDSVDMMKKVTELCSNLGINKIRLLPYHSFGKGKYKDLGREYKFNVTRELNSEDLFELKNYALNIGFDCWIE